MSYALISIFFYLLSHVCTPQGFYVSNLVAVLFLEGNGSAVVVVMIMVVLPNYHLLAQHY